MVRMQLRLKALSPVAFSARRGTTSNFVDTLDYVPGSALRGATAARYLSALGEAIDPLFQTLFVNGEVSFGNLYPVRYGGRSSVIPSTARSCKAFEGFRSALDQSVHGVSDSLMAYASAQSLQNISLIDKASQCTVCRSPTRRFAGFYEELRDPGSPGRGTESSAHSRVEIHKRHLTHVGINRATQSAEPGFLYAQQVISESWHDQAGREFKPQVFTGDLLVSDANAEYVRTELLPRGALVRVGESRSRGLGRMEIESISPIEADNESTIRERVLEFNSRFAKTIQSASKDEYFSLSLQSDAIVTDSFQRQKTMIDGVAVARALTGEQGSDLITVGGPLLVYANAEKRLVQSWNVASGYPKPDVFSIAMGSVFLFKLPNGAAADLAIPLQRLQELGIGERRAEGFGRLKVCDSFHWEVQEHGTPSR